MAYVAIEQAGLLKIAGFGLQDCIDMAQTAAANLHLLAANKIVGSKQ